MHTHIYMRSTPSEHKCIHIYPLNAYKYKHLEYASILTARINKTMLSRSARQVMQHDTLTKGYLI